MRNIALSKGMRGGGVLFVLLALSVHTSAAWWPRTSNAPTRYEHALSVLRNVKELCQVWKLQLQFQSTQSSIQHKPRIFSVFATNQ
jgi:hypothetical protein